MKNTVSTFRAQKGKEKLTMVTAYDAPTAARADRAGVNALLVGDSLGMVVLGYEDTISVTIEDMLHHCKAVARGLRNALLVCDMPYLSYHVSLEESVRNAGRLIQEGHAHAVKLEGGRAFIPDIKRILRAQIPVMGHLGLTPQSVLALGGFKVQGKSQAQAQAILDDARALEDAGVFGLVLEGIPAALAARISSELTIPTIGIGAGAGCDGQVLVWQDMLGLSERSPKFVKRYASLGEAMESGFRNFVADVQSGAFPAAEHCYSVPDEDSIVAQLR